MSQAYSSELRTDTAAILIPLIAGATTLATMLVALADDTLALTWHLWLSMVLAIVSGFIGWRFLKTERTATGTIIFTAVHLLIFFLLILKNWEPGSLLLCSTHYRQQHVYSARLRFCHLGRRHSLDGAWHQQPHP